MKKALIVLAALCLLTTAVLGVSSVSADDVVYGDLNDDGDVNNQDLALMQQYLNGWDVDVDDIAGDLNDDGDINNLDLALMQQYLNGWDVTLGPDDLPFNEDYYNDTELQWP